MNWRPDKGWIKDIDCDCPFFSDSTGDPVNCSQRSKDYEAGASAMLSALIKWLDEPCDNPAHLVDNRDRVDASRVTAIPLPTGKYKASYLHRKDCPTCMNELRGEK